MLKIFTLAKFDPNGLLMAIDSHQMTPLHMAVEGKHLDTVKYLVGQGADTNVKDNYGVSKETVATVDSLD